MSTLSRLLGLDRHPAALKALNDAGHALMQDLGIPTDEPTLENVIAQRLGPVIASSSLPTEEQGLVYLMAATGLHLGLTSLFGEPSVTPPPATPQPAVAPPPAARAMIEGPEGGERNPLALGNTA